MTRLTHVQNIADIREAALRCLPRGVFEFIDRGAEDETLLRHNRATYDAIRLRPNVLVDVSTIDTATKLCGADVSMPIGIAPTGAAGLVWYKGEIALARAAAAARIPFTLATRSLSSIEEVASEAGGILWFQLYSWADRDMTHALVERARAAGFTALLVTVDTAVPSNREYNRRNGFSLPFRPNSRNLLDIALHPGWLATVIGRYVVTSGLPRYENSPAAYRARITGDAGRAPAMRSDSQDWNDLRELRRRWPHALLVKGVLRADDARRAVESGADGVVVSNHGGRNLDSAIAPIEALPEIADAIGNGSTILVDSGVRRGSDVVKALALGASGVMVGRPTLFGTAVGGQAGAAHVIEILRRELRTTMALAGRPRLADIDADLVGKASNLLGLQATPQLRRAAE